ncbi:Gfo/Idh/MocA family oxidoreductase [Marinobacter halodurans]|uniref:Gfo/Idh/MocA family oxidoreductase n=1 Tax=Marinobacter halodurans TaxID=2528979 RepID=A0ABY1ZRW7_9GAMM|nr:Gfo/Idh/MocA family oxidoreductase [Marinobacter halodurans]TBW58444.1 Gfo/Idh/MocA family oxidoreductase [Marinobacter halodurans]
MPATESFRWGIIAPGRIARTFAEALTGVDDAVLTAVASRDPVRGAAFARTYSTDAHSVRVCPDYDSLIAEPDIDGVYIANPHRFHADCVRRCLEAGKPVLCEKPLTVSAAGAASLFELAERRGVFLMEAVWSRFLPVWDQVLDWVGQDAVGEVHTVQSDFCFRLPFKPNGRHWDIHQAGGVTLDMGIYAISLSNYLFGRGPDQVQASVLKGETGVDIRTAALLSYGNAVSVFTSSFVARRDNIMSIEGDAGRIVIDGPFWGSDRATLTRHDGEPEVADRPRRVNGFEYQIAAAMADIRAGRLQNARIPWADTLTTARVIDHILSDAGVIYPFL